MPNPKPKAQRGAAKPKDQPVVLVHRGEGSCSAVRGCRLPARFCFNGLDVCKLHAGAALDAELRIQERSK